MRIILSTRNPSKAEQVRGIFEGSGITILSLDEAGITGQGEESDGPVATLHQNALIKARFAQAHLPEKQWVMADDTGLFIDALDGKPGARAATWAGLTADSKEIMEYTLQQLRGCANRRATFETVVAVVAPDGNEYCFTGHVRGIILEAPRTPPQPKMPYSPIFVPDGKDKVWSQMSLEQENAISHRGQAFRQARSLLEKFVD